MPFSDKKTKSKYFSKKNRAARVFGEGLRNLIWDGGIKMLELST